MTCGIVASVLYSTPTAAQQSVNQQPPDPPPTSPANPSDPTPQRFDMGRIEVIGTPDGQPVVGGALLSSEQMWTFDRKSLDQAVNVVPGVVSTFDANGRRNERDVFVRGFGRQQVPLFVDGVRIYLPADNRLDFGRFLTADIAAIQIQKGFASVLDGPGAMGGAINLVTRAPARRFEAEAGVLGGGRSFEGWDAFAIVGSRQERYYVQSSVSSSDRGPWSLSGDYQPAQNSLQGPGERLGSDTRDWRLNLKFGYTPNDTDEYAVNHTRQSGEKGAPLNVYNNPPVPPNSYWRWPWWDVRSTSLLTTTQLGSVSYVKAKGYYNTLANALDAFDDATYATQSNGGRFHSPYDDHAYGTSIEFGSTPVEAHTIKTAFHYRRDVHTEQQTSRPTHPTLRAEEPLQVQAQYTWSVAFEETFRVAPAVDLIGGVSYDRYEVTKAEDFTAARGVFEHPKGGSDAFNWQGAVIWRYSSIAQIHAGVSDRARFPILFELYSTRFGTATPNPDLGPERATNVEVGWKGRLANNLRLETTLFYTDIRDLIQTVVLPDTTTQTQNVGDGRFYGAEFAVDAPISPVLTVGGNYTAISRTIRDALQPNLRPTGVPSHKAFLYAAWRPIEQLTLTPSLDIAGDRWSDVNTNPLPALPYLRTGSYTLLDVSAQYSMQRNVDVVFGLKNLTDRNYELSWGFPQPGRTFYVKTRVGLS
jgi:iron complex outermembrane recepter protein